MVISMLICDALTDMCMNVCACYRHVQYYSHCEILSTAVSGPALFLGQSESAASQVLWHETATL